jgi:ssDNA-binding Zn-finger/Zn-ribbon topoisomerase 1
MKTEEDCPKCGKGKLEKRILEENEINSAKSFAVGVSIGCGFCPIKETVEYVEYYCNNCTYTRKEKQ